MLSVGDPSSSIIIRQVESYFVRARVISSFTTKGSLPCHTFHLMRVTSTVRLRSFITRELYFTVYNKEAPWCILASVLCLTVAFRSIYYRDARHCVCCTSMRRVNMYDTSAVLYLFLSLRCYYCTTLYLFLDRSIFLSVVENWV